jgi:peptidoglycan/xylan/chitin deacetylase (PgdA/CDA1 family)
LSDVLVLCYHGVSSTWNADLSITPERFEHQLSLLVGRGWRGATFTEAVLSPPAPKTLAVTFDDALASVAELAEPILSALSLPATVFAPTAFVSSRQLLCWEGIDHWQGTPHARELMCMDWEQLRALVNKGWEIGSHSRTHPHLTQIDDSALREELGASMAECTQQLGRPCTSIAYPYGDVDDRVSRVAGEVGYLAGAGLSRSLKGGGPLRWPRVGIYHRDTGARFWLKMTALTRILRAAPLWPNRA